ncbi:MAG: hypothetical protein ACRCY3_00980 [Sphingorhabdus sp.]
MLCNKPFTILSIAGLGLCVTGCSLPQGDFPSLAKRPYETGDPIAEPPSQPRIVSTSLPDALRNPINALVARHETAEAAFRDALGATRRNAQAAAGSAVGSERWVSAQLELSRLEKKRAGSLDALAEIDRLIAAERDKGADAGIIALLEPSQEKVRREVDAQTAIVVELTNLIG